MTLVGSYLSRTEIIVHGGTDLYRWREANRVKVPGAEYTPQYQFGKWDGTRAPGKWCREVSTGVWQFRGSRGLILPLREDFDLRLPDRGPTPDPVTIPDNFRDYQVEALRKSLSERWGRVALATNAGKGAVIALLAATFHQKLGLRSLVLCDEVAVFNALRDEIEKWAGCTPGTVESGVTVIPSNPIVLAMIPTLIRRLRDPTAQGWRAPDGSIRKGTWSTWLLEFEALLLDEADKATAPTWRRVLAGASNSEWRLGFSGTFPMDVEEGDRHARLLVNELMGGVLVQAKNIELVEQGVSARPLVTLRAWDCAPALRGVHLPRGTLAPARRKVVYENAIVYNQARHRFIKSLLRDVPTCVIVNRLDHGAALAREIPGAVFLSGSAPKQEREKVLDRFQAKEFLVLVTTKILDRGTNRLGNAMDLIFASGEGSVRQTLQRVGRGLRRTDGKEFLRLVDIVDRGHKYLHVAAQKRVALYTSEGFDVEVVP